MKHFFKKLRLVFIYGDELEDLLWKKRSEKAEKLRLENKDRLNLCFKHRQEQNHAIYSEHNCDHCKLLDKLNETPN